MSMVRQLRRSHDLSQIELARLAKVSRSTVQKAERGEDITIRNLRKLADALGVAPEKLLRVQIAGNNKHSTRVNKQKHSA